LQVDHVGAEQELEPLPITSREAAEAVREAHREETHGPVHRPGPHPH